jgi:hypothetical protein
MSNKSSLTKVLNVLLKKKYPAIQEIKVFEDVEYKNEFGLDSLKVWIGVDYNDFMMKIDDNELKKEVYDLSKLVLTDGSKIQIIQFFDPD